MTSSAIRQFIAICGGPALDKGSRYEEPLRGPEPAIAFIMGQCDYIAIMLCYKMEPGCDVSVICPFAVGTLDAARWARGKHYERNTERFVVGYYNSVKN